MSWAPTFDQGAAVDPCFDWQERQFIKKLLESHTKTNN